VRLAVRVHVVASEARGDARVGMEGAADCRTEVEDRGGRACFQGTWHEDAYFHWREWLDWPVSVKY
jgi:hypothetical protein